MEWKLISDIIEITTEEEIFNRYGWQIEINKQENNIYVKPIFDKPTEEEWKKLKNKFDEIVKNIEINTNKKIEIQEINYITPYYILFCDNKEILSWDCDNIGEQTINIIEDFFDNDINTLKFKIYELIILEIEDYFDQGFFD